MHMYVEGLIQKSNKSAYVIYEWSLSDERKPKRKLGKKLLMEARQQVIVGVRKSIVITIRSFVFASLMLVLET